MKLWQKNSLILFGLFLTVIILEIGLRIGGFIILSFQEHRNLQSIQQKGSFHIMCLGESTTQGQYPAYLEEILNQSNVGIKFSVIDKGVGGTDTIAILSQLEINLDNYQSDMVITMMGINDDGLHMPCETVPISKTIIVLRSLKVYKLTRLLWLHTVTKLKEIGLYAQDINDQKDKSKEAYEGLQLKTVTEKKLIPNSSDAFTYVKLGWSYKNQGKFYESEQAFKKALELNPNDAGVYAELGWVYRFQGEPTKAKQLFKKAIKLNPSHEGGYLGLGWLYKDQNRFLEAEQLLNKAISLNHANEFAFIGLARFYADQRKFLEAEQLLKKAIEFNPNNDSYYGCLATIYCEIGKNELSNSYSEKASNLRKKYYNPVTINNYYKLKQIIDRRNIKLVCMQYPVRNIEPLKMIFKEEADNVIFVDNERIFKDAIGKKGYNKYFTDMFGGDFGHCTQKGNKLLAENIANAILKEVFNK